MCRGRFDGYMDGAVEGGERAAFEVASALKAMGAITCDLRDVAVEPPNAKVREFTEHDVALLLKLPLLLLLLCADSVSRGRRRLV